MSTTTARQRVLAFLARRDFASAGQVAQALSMSAATVRHHLGILRADGRITAVGNNSKGKLGRPQIMYRLADRLRGENFALLSDVLLGTWVQSLPAARQEAAVQALAEGLAQCMHEVDNDLSVSKRLAELTEQLNTLHYQARWEAGASGPRILFGHCPYAAIIARHPELCRMDALLLRQGMKADVEQLSRIDRTLSGGATHCVFALQLHPGRSSA